MPPTFTVFLHTYDMTSLRAVLEAENYVGDFKLVDDGNTIIVRDINDFKIGSFKKYTANEKTNQSVDK